MKSNFKFKLLLLVAVMATAFFCFGNAQACTSVAHFAQNISSEHVGYALAAVAIVPLSEYVKTNCTITADQIKDLTLKHGKIKIMTVVVEPPTYDEKGNITDKGEFYSYAVKRPDASTIRLLIDYAEKGDNDGYMNCVVANLIVAGDTEIIKQDGLVYIGLVTEAKQMVKPYQSFLVNA